MKTWKTVAAIGVAAAALGALGMAIFRTTTASSDNDMRGLLPTPRPDGRKAPMNPYAAEIMAGRGKGVARRPPPSGQ